LAIEKLAFGKCVSPEIVISMDNKNIKILTGVFVVMVLIIALPWLSGQIGNSESNNGSKNSSLDFSSFSEKSVEKIVIKNGETEQTLISQEGTWKLGNEEVDEAKLSDFFASLKKLAVKEMVSQNEANQAKFGVGKETSIKLILTENGQASLFLVGKVGTTPNQFYMRRDGIKNTYLVESTLRDKLTWDANKWKKTAEKGDSKAKSSNI
jgi:hypothetical protein